MEASSLSVKENPSNGIPSQRPKRKTAKALTSYNEDSLWEETMTDKTVTDSEEMKLVAPWAEINVKVNNMHMQMRKVCNHPYLLEYPLTKHGQYRVDEELVSSCGKTKLLDSLLPALKREGHKVFVVSMLLIHKFGIAKAINCFVQILLFSQMTSLLNILEDYLRMRDHDYCRLDGSTQFLDRQVQVSQEGCVVLFYLRLTFFQIERFNEDPDVFIFLLSTRAGGLGLNLTSADTVIIYDSDWV